MKPETFKGFATGVCSAAILWLTLVPHPLPDGGIPAFEGADKVAHGLMFGGWTVCVLFDRLLGGHRPDRRSVVTVVMAAALFGAAVELAQWAMRLGRGCELLDWVADIVGSLLAGFFFLWLWRRFHK